MINSWHYDQLILELQKYSYKIMNQIIYRDVHHSIRYNAVHIEIQLNKGNKIIQGSNIKPQNQWQLCK